ncbi:MAG: TonB-dependent siderophore receptor, partial [Pseudomonas sp.]
MPRTSIKTPASSPRLLASAIGVAISASSAAQMAQAAEDTEQKGERNSISLGATSITGQEQDSTSYQVEKASSQKYTAPLVDT